MAFRKASEPARREDDAGSGISIGLVARSDFELLNQGSRHFKRSSRGSRFSRLCSMPSSGCSATRASILTNSLRHLSRSLQGPPPTPSRRLPSPAPDGDWRSLASWCLKYHRLTDQQRGFLVQMTAWRSTPSVKQQQYLLRLRDQALRAVAA
jgi:hypothetical protein